MADYIAKLKDKFGSQILPQTGISSNLQYGSVDESGVSYKKIFMASLVVILVLIAILIVIHYLITPIFIFKRGGQGYIRVPGIASDDGKLYWTDPQHGELNESDTIFIGDNGSGDYSVQMDVYFEDINAGANPTELRPIFLRYSGAADDTKPVNYSLGIFLEPMVNDILVQVRTVHKDTEVIKIKNVPSRTPIRLGVVVTNAYFEAYYNGKLVGTRNLRHPIIQSVGFLFGSPGAQPGVTTQTNKTTGINLSDDTNTKSKDSCPTSTKPSITGSSLINLKLWQRAISVNEMQYSTPSMPSKKDFMDQSKFTLL